MNTTTSEAGGCHYAGKALCSSRTRTTRNTACQLRKDCYLPPVNGPLDGILSCSPISSSFSWFLTYSAIRLSFFPTVSTYVDTVGRNKKQIAEYIRNQLASDQIADQIGLKEFVDPFTGRENKKA